MKLRSLLIPALLASSAGAAKLPSQVELGAALAHANAAWGVESPWPVEMRVEDIGTCSGRTAHDVAITQVTERWSQILDGDGKPAGDRSYSYTVIIRFNSECDWSVLNLDAVMEHEAGHVLIGAAYHSKDKRSIMYPLVGGLQGITADDRKLLGQKMAELK